MTMIEHDQSYWVLRTDVYTPTLRINSEEPSAPPPSFSFSMRSGDAKYPIKLNDRIVFAKSSIDDLLFYGWTSVAEILYPVSDGAYQPGAEAEVSVKLSDPKILEPSRPLALFSYSLLTVKQPMYPMRSFRTALRHIDKEDFNTIVRGQIFFSRTAFYKIYDRLPRRLQLHYQSYCLRRGVDVRERFYRFSKRLDLLVQFLRDHLTPTVSYLVQAQDMYSDIKCETKPAFHEMVGTFDGDDTNRGGRVYFGATAREAGAILEAIVGDESILNAMTVEANRVDDDRFEVFKWTALS